MKRLILFGYLLILSLCALHAQSIEQSLRTDKAGQGHVTLHIDNGVMLALQGKTSAEQEEETVEEKMQKAREFRDAEKKRVRGYRVLVYAGGNSRADKNKVEQVGESMKKQFPYYPVYARFESPRWVCRLGNFTNREEAEKVLKEVRDAGYHQAIVTEDVVLVVK